MKSRLLTVEGAVEFAPTVFPDDRGRFVSVLQQEAFAEATGHPMFPVAQSSVSVSRAGVTRGVHFGRTPPGGAKYVYCGRGRALDFVVDLRVGSPTFGAWDCVELDPDEARAVYFPVGVGHAFVALEDHTTMCYLMTGPYVAANELALSVFDETIGLRLPDGLTPVLSERDRAAATLSEARERGMLPDYRTCREFERSIFGR